MPPYLTLRRRVTLCFLLQATLRFLLPARPGNAARVSPAASSRLRQLQAAGDPRKPLPILYHRLQFYARVRSKIAGKTGGQTP